MFRLNLIVFILSFTTFIGATSVKANCLMFGENERLSNYCLLESIKGKLIDQSTANIVVHKLTQEGYLGGLNKPATTFNFYPDFIDEHFLVAFGYRKLDWISKAAKSY